MKKSVSIDDILNSVEFELLQGMLPDDELSKSIHELRAYQTKARADLFGEPTRAPTLDEIADLQLRLNEMLLTLIEVLGQRFAVLQQGFAQTQQRLPVDHSPQQATDNFVTNAPTSDVALAPADEKTSILAAYATPAAGPDSDVWSVASPPDAGLDDGQPAFAPIPETLRLAPDTQPVRLPLVGGFLTRLRHMIHELVLFYVNRLGAQQSAINQQLARQNLALYRSLAAQSEQLHRLRVDLSLLNERLGVKQQPLADQADPNAPIDELTDGKRHAPGDA